METEGPVRSSPVVAAGTVFVGSHEGWDYVTSSVALSDGLVVAGGADGQVRAVDVGTGKVRWSVDVGARVRSSPAIAHGSVYVGSAAGTVIALRLGSGEEIWRFATRGAGLESRDFGFDRRTISGGVTVTAERVLVGSRDGNLYALDPSTGDEIWSNGTSSTAWVISTPAVVGASVIVGRSSSSVVQAFDLSTGALRWETRVAGPVYASPAVVETLSSTFRRETDPNSSL